MTCGFVGAAVLISASWWLTLVGPFDGIFFVGAVAPYLLGAAIIFKRIVAYHPHNSFGAANAVTLARFVFTCLFSGLALQATLAPVPLTTMFTWNFVALAVLERLLDGIDGYFARRQGMESSFGSRFDMEVDALQILLLSIIAFQFDKAGAWVLASGALRYAFLGVGMLWLPLQKPLPHSLRRKGIAVMQGGMLAVLLIPQVVPPLSTAIAALGLALLLYSFLVDTLWVVRSGRQTNL